MSIPITDFVGWDGILGARVFHDAVGHGWAVVTNGTCLGEGPTRAHALEAAWKIR